jgi:hypothetical protein
MVNGDIMRVKESINNKCKIDFNKIDGSNPTLFEKLEDEKVALNLIKNPEWAKLFVTARYSNGYTALHEAASHKKVALEIIKMDNGLKLLLDTKDNFGISALDVALYDHEEIMDEILKNRKCLKFINEIKSNKQNLFNKLVKQYNPIILNSLKREHQKIKDILRT